MQKEVVGIIRVKRNGEVVERTSKGWKKSSLKCPEIQAVLKLYKGHKAVNVLYDTKDSRFLKGQLSPDGREQGARIVVLPNGEKLEKAFSLFSPNLKIHDQDSHDHWDVLYQNKGGTWSYVYTIKKRKEHRARKYRKVHEFSKIYDKLVDNVSRRLKNKEDDMVLPMFTLLKTHIRVGNEIYFKAHGHKGLTTLEKKDISVKGNNVSFSFLGKDGVPIQISEKFPSSYVSRLKVLLKGKGFVFTRNGHCLHEKDFLSAFKEYCGKEFYPHIVRSHYATSQVEEFLKGNKKFGKDEVENLYSSIAHGLGHKKFNKKTNTWDDSFSVTVKSYIQPELVEKVEKRVK